MEPMENYEKIAGVINRKVWVKSFVMEDSMLIYTTGKAHKSCKEEGALWEWLFPGLSHYRALFRYKEENDNLPK